MEEVGHLLARDMSTEEHKELLQEIGKLREEVRSTRRWVICCTTGVVLLVSPFLYALSPPLLRGVLVVVAFFGGMAIIAANWFAKSKPMGRTDLSAQSDPTVYRRPTP